MIPRCTCKFEAAAQFITPTGLRHNENCPIRGFYEGMQCPSCRVGTLEQTEVAGQTMMACDECTYMESIGYLDEVIHNKSLDSD